MRPAMAAITIAAKYALLLLTLVTAGAWRFEEKRAPSGARLKPKCDAEGWGGRERIT
jgi:hypothetical protein